MGTKGSVIRTMAMAAALMLVLTVGSASAQKINMCENDWPVFQIPKGMQMLGMLNDFNIVHEKYEACLFGAKTGRYDIVFFSLFEFMGMVHDSANTVVIGVLDHTEGADMIVLRPEITSASQLKGKSVALQTDTLSLQLLYYYLTKNNMTLEDVKLVHIPVENLSKAFLATNSLAGIVGWNPLTDEAVAGGGVIAASSRDFPDKMMSDLIVVNRDSLKKNRAVYKDFLKKWFPAISNPAVLEKTAEYAKMSVDELKKQLAGVPLYYDAPSMLQARNKIKKETVPELQALFKTKPANIPGAAARFFGKEPLNADPWFDDSLLLELVSEQGN